MTNQHIGRPGEICDLANLGRQRFAYDPDTGVLIWRDPGHDAFPTLKGYRIFKRKFEGKSAGYIHKDGYVRVVVRGRSIQAHRIIWAMVHGYDPVDDIDHKDLCRSNNRLENIREATRSQNCMNKDVRRDNKCGVKGVHWHKASNKWAAQITTKGKRAHLGLFNTIKEAQVAYNSAAANVQGQFRREVSHERAAK